MFGRQMNVKLMLTCFVSPRPEKHIQLSLASQLLDVQSVFIGMLSGNCCQTLLICLVSGFHRHESARRNYDAKIAEIWVLIFQGNPKQIFYFK